LSAWRPSFDFRLIDTPAGSLPCIIRGPAAGPQVLIVPPLFEEMNRTRALLAAIGRGLAERGIGSWLPDLPGTGDSDLALTSTSWEDWRRSIREISRHIKAGSDNPLFSFAVRGGSLLDDAAEAAAWMRLAPVASGDRLLREMLRTRIAADQERGTPTALAALEAQLQSETIELGGYPITSLLATGLSAARASPIAPGRTAALTGGVGDLIFDGPPVWRQAEPLGARALATDLADWIALCIGR
jgi:pimeloyl-ACP methyl ester carboxylesterase